MGFIARLFGFQSSGAKVITPPSCFGYTTKGVRVKKYPDTPLVDPELELITVIDRHETFENSLWLTRYPETQEARDAYADAEHVFVNGELVKDIHTKLDEFRALNIQRAIAGARRAGWLALVNDELVYTEETDDTGIISLTYRRVLRLTRFPETQQERTAYATADRVYVNGKIVLDRYQPVSGSRC